MCGRDEIAHQGLVAEVEQLEEVSLKDFVKEAGKENINLLALEEVTDHRNIGDDASASISRTDVLDARIAFALVCVSSF